GWDDCSISRFSATPGCDTQHGDRCGNRADGTSQGRHSECGEVGERGGEERRRSRQGCRGRDCRGREARSEGCQEELGPPAGALAQREGIPRSTQGPEEIRKEDAIGTWTALKQWIGTLNPEPEELCQVACARVRAKAPSRSIHCSTSLNPARSSAPTT